MKSQGCDLDGKFSLLAHGWEDKSILWLDPLIKNLLKHRGGCVIFVNYYGVIDLKDFLKTLQNWRTVSADVTERLQNMEKEGVDPSNIFMYGFSLGARIVIDAATNFGRQKVGLIDGKKATFIWNLEKLKCNNFRSL